MMITELFDQWQSIRQQILDYFGYKEDWRVFPLEDSRKYFWRLDGEGPGEVIFAETEEDLELETGNCYNNEIYTYQHLPRWVYRGADYTMVIADTHTDGNKFLQIFDNAKERPLASDRS